MFFILRDFIRDLARHWLAFLAGLAGSAVMTLLAALGNLTHAVEMPVWGWAIMIFVAGFLMAAFRLYFELRKQIGTGLSPLPNMSLKEVVEYVRGSAEWLVPEGTGNNANEIVDLLEDLGKRAALSDISVWGATGIALIKGHLIPIPASFWSDHRIEILEFLGKDQGVTEHIWGGPTPKNQFFDLSFNRAQIKYFKRTWKPKVHTI